MLIPSYSPYKRERTTDTLNVQFMEVDSVSEIPVMIDSIMEKFNGGSADTIR